MALMSDTLDCVGFNGFGSVELVSCLCLGVLVLFIFLRAVVVGIGFVSS